jgi:hypothetical protein
MWREVGKIKQEMDTVAASNPNASGRIWDRVRRQMKGEYTRSERLWARIKGVPLVSLGQPSEPDGPREKLAELENGMAAPHTVG